MNFAIGQFERRPPAAGEGVLRALIETSPSGFFLHDTTGQILDVNSRFCLDIGFAREELLRMSVADISLDSRREDDEAKWAMFPAGEAATRNETWLRANGSTFVAEVKISCQIIDGRKFFLGFATDISETVAAQALVQERNLELRREAAERASELGAARERLQAVMDSADEAIYFKDRAGRYLVFNRVALRYAGKASADAIGKTAVEIFGPEIGAKLKLQEERVMATGEVTTAEETWRLRGGKKTLLTTRSPHRDAEGAVIGMVCLARDITELKAAEREILQQRDRLRVAATAGGLGLWEYDTENENLHADTRWYEILGRNPDEPIRSMTEFKPRIHPEDVERVTAARREAVTRLESGQNYAIPFRIVRPTGEIRWVRSAGCVIGDGAISPRRAVGFLVDVTEARLAEERLQNANEALQNANLMLARQGQELEKLSLEDKLTGIANRRCFDLHLDRVFQSAKRTGESFALAIIDVDFFKPYNDEYGHLRGDACLHVVAQTLASIAKGPLDLVARYGGEEFAVLLSGAVDVAAILREACESVRSLALPHSGSLVASYLTISCGGVVADDIDGATPTALLARCDRALYRVKKSGRDGFAVWSRDFD
jgi:diguanylate cyclase (GGDEF)-like protein/PAS domain S-box-containing protein